MKFQRRRSADHYSLYNDVTEPMLSTITTPMPRIALPRESWLMRIFRGLGTFLSFIINKVNQLLALSLATLLLLLFTRFILNFFNFSSNGGAFSFSHWVFFLSAPLVVPFQNIPPLPYNSYTIDVSTLIAILVYAIGITIVRQFLKVPVSR
jgi:YGGT family